MNLLKNFSPVLLGLMMVIFGMNKFIGFIPVEPPADATAQMFMGAMFSSYLYIVVAMLEVGAGIMLEAFAKLGFTLTFFFFRYF